MKYEKHCAYCEAITLELIFATDNNGFSCISGYKCTICNRRFNFNPKNQLDGE